MSGRFQAYDLTLETNHCCPECSYRWQGEELARAACPRCRFEWETNAEQLRLIDGPEPVDVAVPEEESAPREWKRSQARSTGQTAFNVDVEKPPYRIPLMSELSVSADAPTIVSTFSGCGGSCLGFRMAGFRTVWASEFVDAAAETYAANFPNVPLDRRDIRDVQPEEILEQTGLKVGELDVLEGSPPCASFSMAGKRQKHWGEVKKYSDTSQRTDDLFWEYIRLLRGLRPRVFVAENVAGIVVGSARGQYQEILQAMRDSGYTATSSQVLDAQWLGVPQRRRRMIFVGVRDDVLRKDGEPWRWIDLLNMFVHELALPYHYSIKDALPWLAGVGTKDAILDAEAILPTVQTHGNAETFSELTAVPEGHVRHALGKSSTSYGGAGEKDVGDDDPSPAILTGNSHQLEVRFGGGAPRGDRTSEDPVSTDEPSPTVISRPGQFELHHNLGKNATAYGGADGGLEIDIENDPVPAITANAFAQSHFQISETPTEGEETEEATIVGGTRFEIAYGPTSPNWPRHGDAVDPDEPLPTIAAGSKGAGPHQFEVSESPAGGDAGSEATIVGGTRAPFDAKGKPVSGDEPAPSVLAAGGDRALFIVEPQRLASKKDGTRDRVTSVDDPAPTVVTQGGGANRMLIEEREADEAEASIERYAIGKEWDALEAGEQSERYFNLIKPDADEPIPTVTQTGGNIGAASVVHPTEKRKFTMVELRRLCGFPDDFILTGRYSQQWERLGRAVPPPMMRAVAEKIRSEIL